MEPLTSRSAVDPELTIFKYPDPTLAPFGVARDQGSMTVSAPALYSLADAARAVRLTNTATTKA